MTNMFRVQIALYVENNARQSAFYFFKCKILSYTPIDFIGTWHSSEELPL